MKFSIITPSFRNSNWLKLCIASVADQGEQVEHIVQDAGSDDGTQDWLLRDKRVKAFVEKDAGMYDGVNRGLRRASGDIVAYLNCDEQYLPGALRTVEDFFERHPEVDVVFGGGIVVRADGSFLCQRRAVVPMKAHTQVSGALAILSCASFFRRRLLDDERLFFDPRYRIMADAHWVLALLESRARMGIVQEFTSAFTSTGENLSLKPEAQREIRATQLGAPAWARVLRQGVLAHHRLRKLLAGHYWQKPFDYAIYTAKSPERRVSIHVSKPTARWKW